MHSSRHRGPLLVVSAASHLGVEQLSFRVFWQRRVFSVRAPRTERRAVILKDIAHSFLVPIQWGARASRSNV